MLLKSKSHTDLPPRSSLRDVYRGPDRFSALCKAKKIHNEASCALSGRTPAFTAVPKLTANGLLSISDPCTYRFAEVNGRTPASRCILDWQYAYNGAYHLLDMSPQGDRLCCSGFLPLSALEKGNFPVDIVHVFNGFTARRSQVKVEGVMAAGSDEINEMRQFLGSVQPLEFRRCIGLSFPAGRRPRCNRIS